MGWRVRSLDRNDDPYSAWAYERAKSAGDTDDCFCPIIVRVRADGNDHQALLDNLNWIKGVANGTITDGQNEGRLFRMSASDIAHLENRSCQTF